MLKKLFALSYFQVCVSSIVEQTILFSIVSTILWSNEEVLNKVVHGCWKQAENLYWWQACACLNLLTNYYSNNLTEQCCLNIVIMAE